MLQLLDLNKNKIAGLTEYKDLCIESVLKTGDKTLSFLYSNKSKHYFKIVEEAYIRTKQDEFVIKEINVESEFTTFICKLNVEELEGKTFDRFESKEQTITAALNLAIVGTGWTVQDNTINKKRTIRKTNCSSWEIIQDIKNTYRVDIEFDSLNKKIKIHESLGSDKGAYFIDSLNLKSINIQSNSYDFYTRMIPVGKDGITIESVNNGKNYVENYQYSNKVKTIYWKDERYTIKENLKDDAIAKLKEISKPYKAYSVEILNLASLNDKYKDVLDYHLGDTITLISKDNNIKEKQRIVKTKIYPEDHFKDSCELSNTILSFEDIQTQFEEAAETIDNVTTDNGTIDGSTVDSIEVKQIEDFEANVIKVSKLKAILAEIESLHTNKADIQNLNAIVAKIGTLEATKASITELNAIDAVIQNLKTGKADINELNVAVERVGILEGKTLSVENQLAGNLTAKNFKANSITAGSGIIAEGAIGDAEISNLSGNKLRFGTIDTSLVSILGPNGRLRLQGNKLQVLDNKNGKLFERVMLGVDDNNNSSLVLRGSDGSTILLDQNGLTKAGITEGFNKIDDNSIDASLIFDKNSMVRNINGATETIKGTKVTVGDRTLDVELSTQKNTITEHGKELSNQKATINALDNAIKLKVDNQTFTQSTSTINNNINNLNSDLVSKINSSLSTAKLYSDSKANESLNNAKAYTNAQVNTINNNLSKATSEINILKNQISTKVEQVDIDRTVNNIQIGGRNLIPYSNDFTKWEKEQCISISKKDGFNIITRTAISSDSKGIYMDISVIGGQEYTLSFKTGFCNNNGFVGIGSLIPGHTPWNYYGNYKNLENNCKKSYTFKTDVEEKNVRVYFNVKSSEPIGTFIEIKDVKLELGNKATDWTPAPEDIDKEIVDNIKVVTDKINDVSTKLTQTKDSLQASVNSLDSTTQTITTNLTKTNNDLSNKINIAKNDAISSANSHADSVATTKANTAQSTAIAHADSKANDAKNQAINSANTYTNAQITTVNTRVSNAESNINILKNQISTKVSQSDIDRSINSIEFGGRNLILNSGYCKDLKYWGKNVGGGATSKDIFLDNGKDGEYHGPNLTNISFPGGWCILTNTSLKSKKFKFEVNEKYTIKGVIWTDNKGNVEFQIADDNSLNCVIDSIITINGWGYTPFNITFTPKIQGNENSIRFCINKEGQSIFIPYIKLVKGTINGDWTPAPEDIEQEIKDNITTVTTKISNVESNLIQKTDSITQRVNQVESTTNSLNGKITSNTNRISNAESKITPTAIINSVNNSIGSGGVIKGSSTILDKNKFTVMDTDNSKIEMQKGAITAYNNSGKKTYYLDDGEIGICAKDNSDPLGILTSVYKTSASNDTLGNNQSFTTPGGHGFKGVGLLAGDYAGYLTLGYDSVWGVDDKYLEFFRCHKAGWMHMGTVLNFSNEYGIRNVKEINRGNVAELFLNKLHIDQNCINTNATNSKNLWLNYGLGYDCWKANATNDVNVRIGNGYNNGSHGNLVCQSLWVHGNKHRIVDCGDLGFIGMEAYETSTPYFGDIGNAKINEDGICYIIFDREFMEVCDTRTNYKVDISIVSEDLNSKVQVAKKFEDKVKIIGTPGTEFDYEIKAVQKGVDIKRFKRIDEERSDKTNYSINDNVKKLTSKYNNEINPDDGLMKDIELQRSFNLKRTINQLDKKINKAYDILSYIEGRFN